MIRCIGNGCYIFSAISSVHNFSNPNRNRLKIISRVTKFVLCFRNQSRYKKKRAPVFIEPGFTHCNILMLVDRFSISFVFQTLMVVSNFQHFALLGLKLLGLSSHL